MPARIQIAGIPSWAGQRLVSKGSELNCFSDLHASEAQIVTKEAGGKIVSEVGSDNPGRGSHLL